MYKTLYVISRKFDPGSLNLGLEELEINFNGGHRHLKWCKGVTTSSSRPLIEGAPVIRNGTRVYSPYCSLMCTVEYTTAYGAIISMSDS